MCQTYVTDRKESYKSLKNKYFKAFRRAMGKLFTMEITIIYPDINTFIMKWPMERPWMERTKKLV